MGSGLMSQIDAIFQAMTFAEDHLQAPINVALMAEVASYSLYHFCRTFGKVTRHTPYDYLIRRRITQAAQAVVETQQKIIDIAFDYQFNSHEGFTRAFGRMFGLSPTEAREQGFVSALRCLPALTYDHLICLQTHKYLVPEMIPIPDVIHAAVLAGVAGADGSACQPLPAEHNSGLPVPIPAQADRAETLCAIDDSALCACFTLAPGHDDLRLVLDWVLHTWLFYVPYHIQGAYVFVQHHADQRRNLYVPVVKL